ncbi:TIGR02996 domain-containing protein [Gemmata obscuriglobus]|uniref:TIGR02996 domain-containing protein n=1 Tax=Gemmata obscuriglobus TaxID=114 RepID=UPI00016C529D|nr:TIGR02996 domain-containing protein [Gemmata obscuriglobus]VTS10460.1 unnamed protein product [Gemmata obscuriglobus UQM 2246]
MSEDEAFIRAIVDSPGDDTPRLVYADWLDDRADPRGPYLRAEREAVETGDIARLRELAAGLDPVWIARVSMPPVGVCVEHVELERRGPTVSRADIAAIESTISASFPPDYVAFLLNYNGGEVPAFPRVQTAEGEITRVFESGWVFASCGQVKRYQLRPDGFDLLSGQGAGHLLPLIEPVESWLTRHVVIGRGPDVIDWMFLGVDGADRGKLHFLDTSTEIEAGVRHAMNKPPRATSLAEFLASLSDPGWLGLVPGNELPPAEIRGGNEIPF